MTKSLKIILISSAVLATAAAAYFVFRPGKSDLLEYVPEDATALIKIDLPGIAATFSDYESEISQYGFLKDKKISREAPLMRIMQKITLNPVESGIDFRNPSYMFSRYDHRGFGAGLLFSLHDAVAFEALIKKHISAGGAYGKIDEMTYAEMEPGVFLSWTESTMLLSYNKSENKSYPLSIFKNKKRNQKNTKHFAKVIESKTLISGILFTDNLFPKNDTTLRNPFSAGTVFFSELDMQKSIIRQKITYIPGKAGSKDFSILKNKGIYSRYKDKIFLKSQPYYAFSGSFDIPGIVGFLQSVNPDFKENSGLKSISDVLPKIWNGDVVMGISYDKNQAEENPDRIPEIEVITYLGLNDSAEAYLQPYLQNAVDVGGQIRQLNPSAFFSIQSDQLILSTDRESLASVIDGSFQSPAKGFADLKNAADAPLYIAADGDKQPSYGLSAGQFMPEAVQKFLKGLSGFNYVWIEKNTFIYEMRMNNNNTHPFIKLLRLAEDLYLLDKHGNSFMKKNASVSFEKGSEIL